MACKIVKSINNKQCNYATAGATKVWLANWAPPIEAAAAVGETIAYTTDTDGYISAVDLPEGEFFFEIDSSKNTLSFTDALLENGNSGKYRQHTVNMVLNQLDIDALEENDALALGSFVAFVLDKAGRLIVLGRDGGLSAPAGGNDYNSGAASADAMGRTIILQGESNESMKLVKDATVLTPVYVSPVEGGGA